MKSLFLFLFLVFSAHAQVASATLSGTVTDPSGAIVPGATVTLEQKATAFSRATRTDSLGGYVFDQVPPGEVTVSVSAQGFLRNQADFALQVNQRGRHDVQLALGGQDVVNVTAS